MTFRFFWQPFFWQVNVVKWIYHEVKMNHNIRIFDFRQQKYEYYIYYRVYSIHSIQNLILVTFFNLK